MSGKHQLTRPRTLTRPRWDCAQPRFGATTSHPNQAKIRDF